MPPGLNLAKISAVVLPAMKIGIFADLTDETMPILDFAHAVEERGLGGLFLNEHTHLPVDHSTSKFPGGGTTPERYARFWDPYIALSFVAAQTSLEIGTAVSLIGEHDPIALAHQIATLDHLSNGRFVFGVGWGWNREEFANHGKSPKARARVVREWVQVMREIWTNEVAQYDGEFVHLAPSRAWPKPIQKPHPPVILGGPASEKNFRRIAEWCDGWITMGQSIIDPKFAEDVALLRRIWEEAGRDPSALRLNLVYNPLPDAPPLDECFNRARELGAERFLFHVFEGDADRMLRRLDLSLIHI